MNLLKPRLRLISGEILEYIVIYTVALILIAFLLIPFIIMIVQSILKDPLILRGSLTVTIENYLNILSSDLFRRALINSFIVSISTLIITTMLGLLIAFLIVRTDLPLSSIIHKLIYLPIFLGPLLLSFGWAELASSKGSIGSALKSLGIGINVLSIEGIIFVTSIWLMPYSYTFMAAGLRSISQELELSARISGSNMMKAFIAITIPLLYPFILSSSYLVFVLSFEQFTIPMVLGYSEGIFTLITYILLLRDLSVPPPYGAIAALGVTVTSIITIFIVINNMILKRAYRLITITGRGQIMKPINLGIFRWPLATLVLIYIVISSVAPIGALIYRSLRDPGGAFSLINYYDLFFGGMDIARRAIINSVVLSISAAALTLLLSILIVYSRLWGVRIFRYLDWLFWIPIAMPGLILGIGFLWGFLLLKLWFLYPTLLGLLIAYTVRFFPTGNRMASSIITQISPELDHQASICGATLFTRLRKIIMPIG
ncbi:MAG: ABC transporter permease subunit, partial [Desulfurococcales archaeon]|nr:ABC transporter permease subunit [Desulfurococcales archaeon]